jgi:hypothetical protein
MGQAFGLDASVAAAHITRAEHQIIVGGAPERQRGRAERRHAALAIFLDLQVGAEAERGRRGLGLLAAAVGAEARAWA